MQPPRAALVITGMPTFTSPAHAPIEADSAMAAARVIASEAATLECGPEGYCGGVQELRSKGRQMGPELTFNCSIGRDDPRRPGVLVGRTVTVQVTPAG